MKLLGDRGGLQYNACSSICRIEVLVLKFIMQSALIALCLPRALTDGCLQVVGIT